MKRRIAVVTIVHGRHDHLRRQLESLGRQIRRPDLHVVVAMDDPQIEDVVRETSGPWHTEVVHVPRRDGHLPLASARNAGARVARDRDAWALVFLDVDCLASPHLMERYAAVLADVERRNPAAPQRGPTVVSGEVTYLPGSVEGQDPAGLDLDDIASPHPARPVLAPEEVSEGDLLLFWSLSFAITVHDWEKLGGFDEDYVGYGAEDTDFGQRVRAVGGRLLWVGGARAYHQYHPPSRQSPGQLAEIVDNANRFARRWGWWPMEGWLTELEEQGLVTRQHDGSWALARTGR